MRMESTSNQSGSQNGDDSPHDPGKMFVGGLSWQTTPESLKEYFGKYGEIAECMVMRDPITKRSRGFGFVTYKDPASVDKVLANGPHELDTKLVDPKVAFPRRPNAAAQPKMVTRTKKIFVGGLSASTTVEDVKAYFSQFGAIEDAMLMFDKATQRHRGFAFVTFEQEDLVDKVCEIHFHEINNKMVECKKAQPKEVMMPQAARDIALLGELAAGKGLSLTGLPEAVSEGFFPAGFPAYAYAGMNGRGYAGLPGYYIPGFGVTFGPPSASSLRGALRSSRNTTASRSSFLGYGSPVVTSGGVLSVMNNYATSYGPPTSPANNRGFPPASSPGALDMYSPSQDSLGYMQATSPQPSGFTSIAGTLIPTTFQNGFH